MSNKTGMERALELREELFSIANSYAGEETGYVACMLHEACNAIVRAKKTLDGTYDAEHEVMARFVNRMYNIE